MNAVATATGRLTALLFFSDVSVHLVTFVAWLVGLVGSACLVHSG